MESQECGRRGACTLRDAPLDCPVVVKHYLTHMPANRRTQLMAYGLLPGEKICVLQHYPVTVIQIAHTELALDAELAGAVEVEFN
jgi:Fe2+ transport system protein FeoA